MLRGSNHKILITILFSVIGSIAFGQRLKGEPTITFDPLIFHAKCDYPTGSFSYVINVSTGWGKGCYVNELNLIDQNGQVVGHHSDNSSPLWNTGSFQGLEPGMYTYSGSLTVKNTFGSFISVAVSWSIWIGIETSWEDVSDMIESPSSYSVTRNAQTQTYGGAYSNNYVAGGPFWIQLNADFGTTTNSHVYLVYGETSNLLNFNPNGNFEYIHFYKTSSGNGIDVKEMQSGSGYYTHTISTNPNDKVRLVRGNYDLRTIQLNDSPSNIFTFDLTEGSPVNIGVFTTSIDDAAIDVVSTMECRIGSEYVSHAKVKRKLDGGFTLAVAGKLKVICEGEYEMSSSRKLEYRIYDDLHNEVGGSDEAGVTNGGAVAYDFNYDDNRYEIDLSGLGLMSNQYYLFETIDSKGDKRVLKFMFKY